MFQILANQLECIPLVYKSPINFSIGELKMSKKKVSLSEFITKPGSSDTKSSSNWDEDQHDDGHSKDYSQQERRPEKSYEQKPEIRRSEFDESKLPNQGPYVAYVGNLSYDVTEAIIAEFFGDSTVEDIKLVTDRETGKFKGFGYVTFYTIEGLKFALSLGGEDFLGRPVKVDVSEQRRDQRKTGGFERRDGGFEKREGGFERREPRTERVERKPRDYEHQGEEDKPKTEADVDSNWRKKPTGYVAPKPKEREQRQDRPERSFEKRSNEPFERKKLNLAPPSEKKVETTSTPKKDSPFGEGKAWVPKDNVKKLEEKVEKELDDRRVKHGTKKVDDGFTTQKKTGTYERRSDKPQEKTYEKKEEKHTVPEKKGDKNQYGVLGNE